MFLRLRPLRVNDEAEYRAAQAELASDGFGFGFIRDGEPFAEHVQLLERHRRGQDLGDFVEDTFLVADVAGVVVGRASIRHELNAHLAFHGGHIGYCVRPAFRRRGYASDILRQSLVIARSYGVAPVLVTCDDDNLASAAVIERCGGQLERRYEGTSPMTGSRSAVTGSPDPPEALPPTNSRRPLVWARATELAVSPPSDDRVVDAGPIATSAVTNTPYRRTRVADEHDTTNRATA